MRIEINVGPNEPAIYPLSKSKITIGSSDACEIVLASTGISRKHLTIITENDTYFVIDQGSTNGSFMNEERLIPGKKVEFTSFFPVRLGDDVIVSLLSDDELRNSILIPLRETSDGSRTNISRPDFTSTSISRKDFRRDSTGTHTNFKIPGSGLKQKPDSKANKKKISLIPVAAFLLMASAAYWNLFVLEREPDPGAQVAEAVPEYKIPKVKVATQINTDLVPQEDLVAKEDFTRYQGDIKCASDVEVYFCNLFPGIKSNHFGVVQSKLNVNVMIDGTPYFEEAKKSIDPYTGIMPNQAPNQTTVSVKSHDKGDQYTEVHYNMGVYLFLMKHLPLLDEAKTQDMVISVAFYTKNSPNTPVKVIAFTSKGYNKLRPTLKEDQLTQLRNGGEAGLLPLTTSVRIY